MVPLGEERPMSKISVYVYASDPISQIGVASQLRGRPEIAVVDQGNIDAAQVAVVVADAVDEPVLRVLRAIQRGGIPRTVLVASILDDASVVSAAEAGAPAPPRRAAAAPGRPGPGRGPGAPRGGRRAGAPPAQPPGPGRQLPPPG